MVGRALPSHRHERPPDFVMSLCGKSAVCRGCELLSHPRGHRGGGVLVISLMWGQYNPTGTPPSLYTVYNVV